MSLGIYWSPVKSDSQYVGNGKFRDIIREEFSLPCILTHTAMPFLRGVYACGYEEAGILLQALIEHDRVELTISG